MIKTMKLISMFVLFLFLTGCNRPDMIVAKEDKSIVAKCWDGECKNFIVILSEKDKALSFYAYGAICKDFKKYEAVIIDKNNIYK